jgi:hypothetical protein
MEGRHALQRGERELQRVAIRACARLRHRASARFASSEHAAGLKFNSAASAASA